MRGISIGNRIKNTDRKLTNEALGLYPRIQKYLPEYGRLNALVEADRKEVTGAGAGLQRMLRRMRLWAGCNFVHCASGFLERCRYV